MNITFCGANREVTGSCYHIETKHARVVLDCGMFQGGKYAEDKNALPFPFDPKTVDAVVLTHAHFDHTGRLPKLYKEGFRGKIYCTSPTSELAMITLRDAVNLIREEAERHDKEPLFTLTDVEPLEDMWRDVHYRREYQVAPGVTAIFNDAGHILGSSTITLHADGVTAVFSGDLGNTPTPLLQTAQTLPSADVVIIESTYGNRVHEPAAKRVEILKEAILSTVAKKGVLMIPAFAVERAQELLYELNHLANSRQIPKIPMFLDSPMAIAATEVFQGHGNYFNKTTQKEMAHDNVFHFPGLVYTKTSAESKHILKVPGPKVIIAGSGMMNGGRILHHLRNYVGKGNSTLLIIGYQVEGSLGRRLHRKEPHVTIFGEPIDVNADIISCGAFSGHADYPRLMQWMHGFYQSPPRKVYVTHGELNSALSFSQSVEDQLGIASGVPQFGETVTVNALTNAARAAQT